MDGCSHLHISSYFLQEGLRGDCRALFAEAHRRGMTTSLDPGFDPTEKWDSGLRDTLTEVDVFFPNEVELRGAGGSDEPIECLRRLDNGRTLVMAKLGREGCMSLEGGSAVHVPAFAVRGRGHDGRGRFVQRRLPACVAGPASVERGAALCRGLRRVIDSGHGRHGQPGHGV